MTPAIALLCLLGSALLDLLANALLKKSDGFRRPLPGILALLLVLAAFALLGLSLQAVPLSVAYAVWGGMGIAGAALLSRYIEGLSFGPKAWAGLALVLGSVLTLHLTHAPS